MVDFFMGNVGKQSIAHMDLYGFRGPSGRNQSSQFFSGDIIFSYPFPRHILRQITIVPKPEINGMIGGIPLLFTTI